MKIAMIGQKGIPAHIGGIERHVEELSVRLACMGNDVTVYTRPSYTPKRRATYRGVHLVSLPSIHTKNFDAITHSLIASIHAIFISRPDVIHYHGVGPSLLAFLPRLFRPRAKVICTIHCLDRYHQKWGILARWFLWMGEWAALLFAHETIAVSKTIRSYCKRIYKREAVYIPNGVSTQERRKGSVSALKRFNLERSGYILTVSRLIRHKGIHTLIEAYKGMATAKKLVIVGGGFHTDSYVDECKALSGDDPRIIMTGPLYGRMLAELFRHAAFFVLPSESEGLPITLLEAASYAQCPLVSNIPENLEVLNGAPEPIGRTFRKRNIKDLRKQLGIMVRMPQTAKAYGKRAQAFVRRAYNWTSIAKDTEGIYSRIERVWKT